MRTRWMLIVAFLVVFLAGGTFGALVGVRQQPPEEKRPDRPERFIAGLDLTEAQQEQMKQIWTDAMREQMQSLEKQRRELYKQREEAIEALMTDEQRAAVAEIEAEHDKKSAEIRDARRKVFEEAHEKTRAILTPEQRERFDAELERRREEWGSRGFGRGGRGGPGGPGAAGGPGGWQRGDGDAPPPPPGSGRPHDHRHPPADMHDASPDSDR